MKVILGVPRAMRTATLLATGLFAGCRALPPAPVTPFHASTAAEAVDEVTVSLILGIAMQPLGGAGVGSAIRVEQQVTDRTALGGELTIGWVDADGDKLWMFALRGYGQGTPRAHDWVALTYGAGVSVLTTGMVSLQLMGGGALAYPNDHVVPYLAFGAAASVPVVDGRAFGHLRGDAGLGFSPAQAEQRPRSEFYVYGSVGTVVPLGDTGNALSLDLGVSGSVRDGTPFLGLSLADTQH